MTLRLCLRSHDLGLSAIHPMFKPGSLIGIPASRILSAEIVPVNAETPLSFPNVALDHGTPYIGHWVRHVQSNRLKMRQILISYAIG